MAFAAICVHVNCCSNRLNEFLDWSQYRLQIGRVLVDHVPAIVPVNEMDPTQRRFLVAAMDVKPVFVRAGAGVHDVVDSRAGDQHVVLAIVDSDLVASRD